MKPGNEVRAGVAPADTVKFLCCIAEMVEICMRSKKKFMDISKAAIQSSDGRLHSIPDPPMEYARVSSSCSAKHSCIYGSNMTEYPKYMR